MKPFQKLVFEKNRKKALTCPCGKDNKDGKFCPYEGFKDKGYCFSCGETFLPGVLQKTSSIRPVVQKPQINKLGRASTIPSIIFFRSLRNYQYNNFALFLIDLIGLPTANEVVGKYLIGTSDYWSSATIFWQVAKSNTGKVVRSGKIIQYNIVSSTDSYIGKDCKRNKNNNSQLKWAHKLLPSKEYNLRQCFFGEHLLTKDYSVPIAICESEKTAVIASAYLPQFTWLAAGSLTGLSRRKFEVLRGRKVILFPDLNGFESWTMIAKEFSDIATVEVSDLLQRKATDTERNSKLDLADYLIRFNYKTFNKND